MLNLMDKKVLTFWDLNGSVVEYLSRDRGVAVSSLASVTALFS